ncbi:DEAD/DEAH box helicase [bacterium]|nr:DEAD/DEAH box helicase [bacterium]
MISFFIPITHLLSSEYYSEGSRLYAEKRGVVTGIEYNLPTSVTLRAFFSTGNHTVNLIVSTDEISTVCSCGERLCKHAVAAALQFNEMSIGDELPDDQIIKLAEATAKAKHPTFPLELRIVDGALKLKTTEVPIQLLNVFPDVSGDITPLVALSPELFTFQSKKVRKTKKARILLYTREHDALHFSLPLHLLFFKQSALLFDKESVEILSISSEQATLLNTLLRTTIQSDSIEKVVALTTRLNKAFTPTFKVKGDLNASVRQIDDSNRANFLLSFNHNKTVVDVAVQSDDSVPVPLNFSRADKDHSYLIDGILYTITPQKVKSIKQFLRSVGLTLKKGVFSGSAALFTTLSSEQSPLYKEGEVERATTLTTVSYTSDDIEQTSIVLNMDKEGSWFSFSVTFPSMNRPLQPDSLISAIREYRRGVKAPLVMDEDGDLYRLEDSESFLKNISELLYSDAVSPGKKMSNRMLPHLLAKKANVTIEGDISALEKKKYQEIVKALQNGEYPELEKMNFPSVLRKYQKEGIRWMQLLFHLGLSGILADEMGLGKTVQALTVLQAEKRDRPSLVVAPKTLIWTWKHEITKFFPEMETVVIDSFPPKEREELWKRAGNSLIITSYSILVNDFSHLKSLLFNTLVVDEAQHIKNSSTRRFKTIKAVKSMRRIALTGTPLENRPSELWSIFNFLMPGFLGVKKEIVSAERNGDIAKLQEFSLMASPFMLRRTKRKIMPELPDLIVRDVPVEMPPMQRDFYLSLLLRSKAEWIDANGEMGDIDILRLLTRLRMAADHPSLVGDGEFSLFDSGKITVIKEIVEDIVDGEGRVLIFSQFLGMLAHIRAAMEEMNIPYYYIDGSTKERQKEIDAFNEGGRAVFILSLKVGGVGLNLTAADNVIITDPWWNPAVEEQAWSRAHRIGQKKTVVVHKLYSINTVEEKILKMQMEKRNMVDMFLSKAVADPQKDFVRQIAKMEFIDDMK